MWKKIGIRKTSNDPMSPGSETPERSYKRKFPLRDPIDYNKFTRSNSPKSLNASKTEVVPFLFSCLYNPLTTGMRRVCL